MSQPYCPEAIWEQLVVKTDAGAGVGTGTGAGAGAGADDLHAPVPALLVLPPPRLLPCFNYDCYDHLREDYCYYGNDDWDSQSLNDAMHVEEVSKMPLTDVLRAYAVSKSRKAPRRVDSAADTPRPNPLPAMKRRFTKDRDKEAAVPAPKLCTFDEARTVWLAHEIQRCMDAKERLRKRQEVINFFSKFSFYLFVLTRSLLTRP